MPCHVSHDRARFIVKDGQPILVLAAGEDVDLASGEWSLSARSTLTVLDGPGEQGFLISRLHSRTAPPRGFPEWDEAVDEAGGAIVVALPDVVMPDDLPPSRAVFVRSLPEDG